MSVTACIYVTETTSTHASQVTSQGFGTSSPLSGPQPMTTNYHYAATWPKDQKNVSGNSNTRPDLRELAENFRYNSKNFPVTAEAPFILLSFEPTTKLKEEKQCVADAVVVVRALTEEERETFLAAYRGG